MSTCVLSRLTRTRGGATPAWYSEAEMPIVRRMSRTFASPIAVPSGRIRTWCCRGRNELGQRVEDLGRVALERDAGLEELRRRDADRLGSPFSRITTRTPRSPSGRRGCAPARLEARLISLRINALFEVVISSPRIRREDAFGACARSPRARRSGPMRATVRRRVSRDAVGDDVAAAAVVQIDEPEAIARKAPKASSRLMRGDEDPPRTRR